MENNDVIVLRLYSGEMLIGRRYVTSDPREVVLLDPRSIVIVPNMQGGIHIAMRPVCAPFAVKRLEQELSVKADQVMFTLIQDEIDKELVNGYKSEISGIKIASTADTMAIAANQQRGGGEFIL